MSDPEIISVNGNEIALPAANSEAAPANAKSTDWIVVKFDRFVDYDFKQELLLQKHLEVHDRVGDDNTYLCKYTPDDLAPVANDDSVSHLTLYPPSAVLVAEDADTSTGPVRGVRSTNGNDTEGAGEKVAFEVGLHPNPSQTPEQVLETIQARFGAERMDDRLVGSKIRVRIDPSKIPEVAKMDSVRSLSTVKQHVLYSLRQRAILQFSGVAEANKYRGDGEVIFMADSGFDMGDPYDVHPAFTGRVLATTTAGKGAFAADWDGHGTHVAGSMIADLPGSDLLGAQGTAPGAKLVSIAIPLDSDEDKKVKHEFPQALELFRMKVEPHGKPVIMNNSWGVDFNQEKECSYVDGGADDVDKAMFGDPNLCLVFAAGNDGELMPDAGERQQIGDYGAGKNCITVGASYSDRPLDETGTYSPTGMVHSTSEWASYSSTGPTPNGRLKPDVLAPGSEILSTRSRTILPEALSKCLINYGAAKSEDLLFLEGTSQAAPAVTGCVAVLRSVFREKQRAIPTGAMLKALIIHGAVDLAGITFTLVSRYSKKANKKTTKESVVMTGAPNAFQGYGRVNIDNSLYPILQYPINGQRGFLDGSLGSGASQPVYTLDVPSGAKRLTVTLAYTDAQGETIQTIIRLSVRVNGQTQFYSPLQPTDPLGRQLKWTHSNVSKIVQENPPPGSSEILLSVQTSEQTARYAVVWTVV